MTNSKSSIDVINDDPYSLHWSCSTIELLGWTARVWDSPLRFREFVKANTINCLIVGHYLPGYNADAVLSQLQLYEESRLSIVVTGSISVRVAVRMMQHGAFDLITRPRETERLKKNIREIMHNSLQTFEQRENLRQWKQELWAMSELEQQIARGMTKGVPNAVLARQLGLGVRTVEKYRRQVLDKFKAKSIPDLIKIFYDVAPELLGLSAETRQDLRLFRA